MDNEKEVEQAGNPGRLPQKKSVALLWLLSIITFGIYSAVWYIQKSPEFDNLNTKKKLNKKLGIVFLILMCLYIFLINFTYFGTIIFPFIPQDIFLTFGIAIYLSLVVVILAMIVLGLFLAFHSRAILNQALEQKGVRRKISWLFTLVFNFLYLQYEINRIIDDRENEPRKGPWIFFILFFVLGLVVPLVIGIIWIILIGNIESEAISQQLLNQLNG